MKEAGASSAPELHLDHCQRMIPIRHDPLQLTVRQHPARGRTQDQDIDIVREQARLAGSPGRPAAIDQHALDPFHAVELFAEEGNGTIGGVDDLAHGPEQRVLVIGSHTSIAPLMTVTKDSACHEAPHLTMNHGAADAGASTELS